MCTNDLSAVFFLFFFKRFCFLGLTRPLPAPSDRWAWQGVPGGRKGGIYDSHGGGAQGLAAAGGPDVPGADETLFFCVQAAMTGDVVKGLKGSLPFSSLVMKKPPSLLLSSGLVGLSPRFPQSYGRVGCHKAIRRFPSGLVSANKVVYCFPADSDGTPTTWTGESFSLAEFCNHARQVLNFRMVSRSTTAGGRSIA